MYCSWAARGRVAESGERWTGLALAADSGCARAAEPGSLRLPRQFCDAGIQASVGVRALIVHGHAGKVMDMAADAKAQDRNLEGIIKRIQDYFAIRTQQSIRVNPGVANVIEDVVWTQVENLRLVLTKTKAFGPERVRVCDILVCEDDNKRRAMFSHSDQNSIISEVLNRADDQRRAMAEYPVHDMRTYYRALNPSLEQIVQLIQHWIIWDLPDAAELHHFEELMRRLEYLRTQDLPDELLAQYRPALGRGGRARHNTR